MYDANILMNLYKLLAEKKLDRSKFLQMIARAVVQETGASRGSIWFYLGDLQDQAICESLYDAADNQWSSGTVIVEDDFGPYFEALRTERQVIASEARTHPVTACFNESYFEPLNIYSLLDYAIEMDGTMLGIVCCENTASVRDWSQQDALYVKQVAAMIALAIKKQVLV